MVLVTSERSGTRRVEVLPTRAVDVWRVMPVEVFPPAPAEVASLGTGATSECSEERSGCGGRGFRGVLVFDTEDLGGGSGWSDL
jgi:hypothetical protein